MVALQLAQLATTLCRNPDLIQTRQCGGTEQQLSLMP